jgi:hypothetical protein
MELFLNLLWVLITLAGVLVWRTCWSKQRKTRRHAAWRDWTAFVCAMILLFFVVSLTDDLHAEVMFVEECSTSRRQAICLASPHQSSPAQSSADAQGWMLLPSGVNAPSFVFISSLIPVSESVPMRLHCNLAFGRAPPVTAL